MSTLSFLLMSRFSRKRNHNKIVVLISAIPILGIALGVAVLIIGLSAMNGFERELHNRILSIVPHGEIKSFEGKLTNWEQIIPHITCIHGIISATPYINFAGLAEKGTKILAIQVQGIDPKQNTQSSMLSKFVQNHSWKNFRPGKQQIIIGSGVSKLLNVNQGDWLTILIPKRNNEGRLTQTKYIRLQVIDILQLHGMLDHNLALIPISDAQYYLGMEDSISGIALKMSNPFDAVKIIQNISKVVDSCIYVLNWIDTYGYMYRDIQMIRIIIYLAMVLVISIACFNIVSNLVIAVKDKSSDIAILRTLGAQDKLIYITFIWYGLRTSLLGSLIGIIIGISISLNLTRLFFIIEKFTGFHFLSGDIYFIDFLPSELHWLDILIVLLISIVLSLLASWYPAKRASFIDPVTVLNKR